MTRNGRHSVFLLALLALLLVSVPVSAVEITAVVTTKPGFDELANAILAELRPQFPSIELVVLGGGSAKVDALIAADTPPDLQRVGFETFGQYASKNLMYDITPLLQRSNLTLNDFFPASAAAVRWGKAIYALPLDVKLPVMMYNKAMVDAAGLAPPTRDWFDPNWSVEAFYSFAKKLTRDDNGDGIPEVYGTTNIAHYQEVAAVETFGAQWTDDSEQVFLADSLAMRKAIEFWSHVQRDVVGGDLYKGTAAITMNMIDGVQRANEVGIEWDIAALPYEMPVYLTANAWRFYKGSNPMAAWEFVRRLVFDPRRHAEGAAIFGGLPSQRQALALALTEGIGLGAYLNKEQQAMVFAGISEKAKGVHGANKVYFESFIRKGVSDVFSRAITGVISPDEAIMEARALFNSIIAASNR